jgi:hypothetical protein
MMTSNQVDVPAAAGLLRWLMIAAAIFDAMISIAINISKRIFCNTLLGHVGWRDNPIKGRILRPYVPGQAVVHVDSGSGLGSAPGAAVAALKQK